MLVDRTVAGTVAAGTDERLYVHQDRRSSVTGLSNIAGAVVERYAYTPYGETSVHDAGGTVISTGTAYGQLLGYTGRRLDPETGTLYFRARTFDPRLGRFLSRDPLMYPDGPNAYAGWHGIEGVDPDGLEQCGPTVWVYTGSYCVSDDVWDAATGAAGESYTNNAGNAHEALEIAGNAPGLGVLADATDATLTHLEGPELNARARANANPALCALNNGINNANQLKGVKKLGKAGKALGGLAGTGPNVKAPKPKPQKPGPKTDPNAPHNKKIREEAEKLKAEGNTIIAGGGGKEN